MLKSHFAHCLVGVVAVVGLLLVFGVQGGSLFWLLPVLVCPVMMVFMMWVMMRGVGHAGTHPPDNQQSDRDPAETTAQIP